MERIKDYEVVVVGAGAAGLCAAMAAADGGARTVVLEKAPNISNTNTSRGAGYVAIAFERELYPDSPRLSAEEKIEEAQRLSGNLCKPELIKAWREHIDETLDWLTSSGLKWHEKNTFDIPREAAWQPLGGGPGLNKQLLKIAQQKGCHVVFNHKAQQLLVGERGHIAGVRVNTGKGLAEYLGKAVVLATAGFQSNQEMLTRYFGAEFAYNTKLTGSPWSTGDGHIMAQEAGARLNNMTQFHSRNIDRAWYPGVTGVPGPMRELQLLCHHAILVNKLGKRFMDEADTSNTIANSIRYQPGEEVAMIFDESIKRLHPAEVEGYRPPGIIQKLDTIEGVANCIQIDQAVLAETMRTFNDAVVDGRALGLDVSKRDFAHRLETPPFYVIYPIWAGLNCTLGGPEITCRGEVLDRDGAVIDGLYAAGEMVGGFFAGRHHKTPGGAVYYKGNYQVTTAAISYCLVSGYLAGSHAAGLVS